ncbi:RNA polymerase sigma-70 factor, ECF subfamily [Singulisphaera sp. GP187]|nr:RNA polymerase sigma-70 factor, ECF subfamily [Singulisphaera sp. GP187]
MAGDPDEWEAWLDRHGATLVLLARQRVASRADAEDVVQEAFVRFWRSRQRANDPTAYLYTCVQHCALNWQRSRERRSRREEVAARPEAEAEDSLTGPLGQEERREAIEAVLRSLPEPQREVLVMKVWGGLSFPQIAEAAQISVNTAASRYRYALAKLRERLAEEPTP